MDIENLIKKAEENVKPYFEQIGEIVQCNTEKVLRAFHDNKISTAHFAGTNGYGYDDAGREVIDKVFAQIFRCEDALVRYNFVNGTHALSTAFWGILRPLDKIVYLDRPYDTLCQVIGLDNEDGSLKSFGIKYIEANNDNVFKIVEEERPKLVCIQKSKGYDWNKKGLICGEIKEIISQIKKISPKTIVLVDNCYGEFVEKMEPTEVGADLVVGSLIKNCGGGIAQTGGYIAGRADLVEKCANRLTAVGLGRHVGCTLGANREILQGIFMAPHIVGEALKTAAFASEIFDLVGYEVAPRNEYTRGDIVQAIKLGTPEKLIAFCQAIQSMSPIDSHVSPLPWAMPGYADEVIMAAGTFVQGSSLELTADSALREPYVAYLQGGLTYESGKLGVIEALRKL